MASRTEFSDLLDRLVREYVADHASIPTVSALAKFLGISSPQLSRLRSQTVPLTKKTAVRFAERIGATAEDKAAVLKGLEPFVGGKERPRVGTDLSECLDSLVRDYPRQGGAPSTLRELAALLGISSVGMLSRLRMGKIPLTNKMARKFANRIGRTPAESETAMAALRAHVGVRSEIIIDPAVSDMLGKAILRCKTREDTIAVLTDGIETYRKYGYPTDRLEVCLSAVRIQIPATFDLGDTM